MSASPRQKKESSLRRIRETEGWTIAEVARASDITPPTWSKAENGKGVRKNVWGKVLKGINSMSNKSRTYVMSDIREQ
jgi:transcriptional regulator with XRE-family HTH domain